MPTREDALGSWRAFAKALDKQCAALTYVYTQDTDLPAVDESSEIKICTFDAQVCLLNDPTKTVTGRDATDDERQLVLKHWLSLGSVMGGFDVVVVQNLTTTERMNVFLSLLGQGTSTECSWSYVTSNTVACKRFHAMFVKTPLSIESFSNWTFANDVFFDSPPLQALVKSNDELLLISSTCLSATEKDVFFGCYDQRVAEEFKVHVNDKKKKQKTASHVICGRGLVDTDTFFVQAPDDSVDNIMLDHKTEKTTFAQCSALKLASKLDDCDEFGLASVFPVVLSLEF